MDTQTYGPPHWHLLGMGTKVYLTSKANLNYWLKQNCPTKTVQARKTKDKQHTGPPRWSTSKQAKVDIKKYKEGTKDTNEKVGVATKAWSLGHKQCHFLREQEGSG